MKNNIIIILIISFLIFPLLSQGQSQLNEDELNKLVRIGELYSSNPNARGKKFKKSTKALRSTKFNHIIDALILIGKGDKKLLTNKYLTRPTNEELKYWYVIREIHYNLQSENETPKSSKDVATEILEKEIDERWLVDNYYYRIQSGIATLFNDKNLSKYNFELDDYGLKNDTEKAILYFNLINALGVRFKVLQMLKNDDQLLKFAEKMPTINGKNYYEYTNFDFEDFDWIGYDKIESYKTRHLEGFYSILLAHFSALANKNFVTESRSIYFQSILYIPKYFEYTATKGFLNDLYTRSKK